MADSVTEFMQLAPQLITEAAQYAGRGEDDPAIAANIRQLKIMAAALVAALQAIRT